MEFNEIYNDFYAKTYFGTEQKIKEDLITSKAESRSFSSILNEINKKLENKINANEIIADEKLLYLDQVFQNNLSEYSENSIELSLKNHVYPEFLKLNQVGFLTNYSFDKFLCFLGTIKALKKVANLFSNNSRLFEMMFILNDFKGFELAEYPMILDNTPLFKKLHTRLYPQQKSKAETKKNQTSTSDIDPIFTLLNNDEKIILLHIVYNTYFKDNLIDKKPKIDLTEFARIIYLTKESIDVNIFDKNYASRTFYKKLNEGIIYSDSLDKRSDLITSLLEKIEILNLNSIKGLINSQKTTTIKKNKK